MGHKDNKSKQNSGISRRAAILAIAAISIASAVAISTGWDYYEESKRERRQRIREEIEEESKLRSIVDGYPVLLEDDKTIQGPGWSVKPGDLVGFALSTGKPTKRPLKIEDALGNVVDTLPEVELRPQQFAFHEPWKNGAGYNISAEWRVPETLKSGMYFLEGRPDLFVVVREPKPAKSLVAILISTNTFNAYSNTEKRSLYNHPIDVPEVSFVRPFNAVKEGEWLPFVKWVTEKKPFRTDVRYLTDSEMENPSALEGVELLTVLGHSEYWTRNARKVFDNFVDNGGNAIIASGNTMWWQVRYGENNTLICYKSNALNPIEQGGDPIKDPLLKTINWYKTTLAYPITRSIGGDFNHGGNGDHRFKKSRGWFGMRAIYGDHPLFRGLDLQDCSMIHSSISTTSEYDGAPILGLDKMGRPVADIESVGAKRLEIIAFDWGYRGGHTIGTMHLVQRSDRSGVVLHLGGKDQHYNLKSMRKIFQNAADYMLNNQTEEMFSNNLERQVVYPMTTPWKGTFRKGITGRCAPRLARGS